MISGRIGSTRRVVWLMMLLAAGCARAQDGGAGSNEIPIERCDVLPVVGTWLILNLHNALLEPGEKKP